MPENLPFIIATDDDGGPVTKCPHCGALDSINEVDVATRWNTLSLRKDDPLAATAYLGDGDWEFERWLCQECLSSAIEAPEGFEITDWI